MTQRWPGYIKRVPCQKAHHSFALLRLYTAPRRARVTLASSPRRLHAGGVRCFSAALRSLAADAWTDPLPRSPPPLLTREYWLPNPDHAATSRCWCPCSWRQQVRWLTRPSVFFPWLSCIKPSRQQVFRWTLSCVKVGWFRVILGSVSSPSSRISLFSFYLGWSLQVRPSVYLGFVHCHS